MGTARTHVDLFSGIGGFALACMWLRIQTIAFCEIEKYAQRVLRKNFPGTRIFEDVRTFPTDEFQQPWLLTGGYPCQPFSSAGLRRGEKDDRHLWPEMLRIIQESRPHWVLAENVAGHISMGLDEVLSNLEGEDYACQPFVIPACAKDANHRRDRVWIVGNANTKRHKTKQGYGKTDETEQFRSSGTSSSRKILGNAKSNGLQRCRSRDKESVRACASNREEIVAFNTDLKHECQIKKVSERSTDSSRICHVPDSSSRRCEERESETKSHPRLNCESQRNGEDVSNSNGIRCNDALERQEKVRQSNGENQSRKIGPYWGAEPNVGRVAHGIPNRVDRLRGLGNAIVPQVAYEIIKAMIEAEETYETGNP